MTRDDVFDAIQRLRAAGRPFAVATVIRTEDATSARPGDKAVIDADGAVLGHLGGGCVTRAVRHAAEAVRLSGAPRVIRVRPKETVVDLTDTDGAAVYRSGCPSGGSVELLVEPFTPPERLVVFGDGAVARAVEAIGASLRLRVSRAATPQDGAPRLDARDMVVVATQGHGDLPALRAALSSDAGFVGFVASRRKAAELGARLSDGSVPRERLDRLRSPVGLDIGATAPEEIAVSIAAELIAHRRSATRPIPEHDAALTASGAAATARPVMARSRPRSGSRWRTVRRPASEARGL
jgi:xanthine dehydrogenase accessory factor